MYAFAVNALQTAGRISLDSGINRIFRWGALGGLTLALVACGGPAAPQATDQDEADSTPLAVVVGRVATWKGEGRVTVPGVPSASSSVRPDGTFTLTLPRDAELVGLTVPATSIMTGLGCAGDVQSSAADARTFTVVSLDTQDSAGLRQTSAVTGSKSGLLSRHIQARAWVYSDTTTQLRGLVDCAAILNPTQVARLPVTVAINVRPGWTAVELSIDASSNIFAQISASGSLANSTSGAAVNIFRTTPELQAQIGF